jgi:hypothetical protein
MQMCVTRIATKIPNHLEELDSIHREALHLLYALFERISSLQTIVSCYSEDVILDFYSKIARVRL